MRAAEGEVRILISSAKIKSGLNLHAKTCDFDWQGAESSARPAEASSRSKHKFMCWQDTEALRVENSCGVFLLHRLQHRAGEEVQWSSTYPHHMSIVQAAISGVCRSQPSLQPAGSTVPSTLITALPHHLLQVCPLVSRVLVSSRKRFIQEKSRT